jgi:hypothetical protein
MGEDKYGKIVYMFDWREVYADVYRAINELVAKGEYKAAKLLIISNIATFLGFLEYNEKKASEIIKDLYDIKETDIYRLQFAYALYAKKLELGPIAAKTEKDSFFDRMLKKIIEKNPDLIHEENNEENKSEAST